MNKVINECKSCSKEPSDRVNIARFIDKLDSFFKKNDLEGANKHLAYWEETARSYNDLKGLLSILNEEVGFYRRTNDKEKGLKAVYEVIEIINNNDMSEYLSSATILLNAATTLKAFNRANEGIGIYDKVEKVYREKDIADTFEFATLLNNKASSLYDLEKYDEAEKCLNEAIEILNKEEKHDGDIAISLLSLAHLYFERDNNYELVEETLDKAWEYINSERIVHDHNYAYTLQKCVSSYRYFKRDDEANALEEVAEEIYRG